MEEIRIIADENIPFIREAFGNSNIELISGREINNSILKNKKILLIRSITKINSGLLGDTMVKFVASATTGMDHIDTKYLLHAGIGFYVAEGCNANSVAEYVFAALYKLAVDNEFRLEDKTLGIVGVGRIGGIVRRIAEGIGMKVLLNDPPLKRKNNDNLFLDLDELMDADIITIHVPLIREGTDKTAGLFDTGIINKMKKGSILINTSRGNIVSSDALKNAMKNDKISSAVIDVWENEPVPDTELMEMVSIATPHIAGYSFDGKINGSKMIYKAVCEFLSCVADYNFNEMMPPPLVPLIEYRENDKYDEVNVNNIIKWVYDINADSEKMKFILGKNSNIGSEFDRMRREYHQRREFFNTEVRLKKNRVTTKQKLSVIGFKCTGS